MSWSFLKNENGNSFGSSSRESFVWLKFPYFTQRRMFYFSFLNCLWNENLIASSTSRQYEISGRFSKPSKRIREFLQKRTEIMETCSETCNATVTPPAIILQGSLRKILYHSKCKFMFQVLLFRFERSAMGNPPSYDTDSWQLFTLDITWECWVGNAKVLYWPKIDYFVIPEPDITGHLARITW